ncbi:hypothetical protein JYK00_03795 [Thermosipho ferrireducens]|uniref:Lipoprotein n=1 Tax=Thermosipho ferrireducens TaxID=2571116 RepID=A0ABX7SA82_9BACT|nr:hypothetical protein [Thermosipho ferrireducens]QTA38642.1 hypothetical protein JYK00_03795 [Thermosipho ferrireducens]
MKVKLIAVSFLLILLFIFSGCGIFQRAFVKYTDVSVIDPEGNKIYIEGTLNGSKLLLDEKTGRVYIKDEIKVINNVDLQTEIFNYKAAMVDGRVLITLSYIPDVSNKVELHKQLNGNLILYARNIAKDTLNIWLKNRFGMTSGKIYKDVANGHDVIVGGYLIGIAKLKEEEKPIGSVAVKLDVKNEPEIVRIY